MQNFIKKYTNNVSTRTKFIKTPLHVQGLLNSNFPSEVKIYPITVNLEVMLYESIKSLVEGNVPLQFIMFEDILPEVVSSGVDLPLNLNELSMYDINYIMYNSRILSYGNTQDLTIECRNCRTFYREYKAKTEEIATSKLDPEVANKELDNLVQKYHVKFNDYDMLKDTGFYTTQYKQDLTKFQMVSPDSKDDLYKTFTTISGNVIKMGPPRLGYFKHLKPYLIDFRNTIEDVYKKNDIKFVSQEEEYKFYSQYQNIQLFIYSIDGEVVKETDIHEIPIVIKNIFTKQDITNISVLIQELDRFNVTVPFTYKCPTCGTNIIGDVTQFPTEYLFGSRV